MADDDDNWKDSASAPPLSLEEQAQSLGIRWDSLPQRPAMGVLTGYNTAYYRKAITSYVQTAQWVVKRDLTPEEVQVFSGLRAEALRIQALEIYPVFLTTYLLHRKGAATFRFPFYTPKKPFTPTVFPHPAAPLLQGALARTAWHGLRIAAYAAVSTSVFRTILFSYASMTTAAAFRRDPRLEQYENDLRAKIARGGGRTGAPGEGQDGTEPRRAGLSRKMAQAEAWTEQVKAETREQAQRGPTQSLPWQRQKRSDDDADPFAADDASPVAPPPRGPSPASSGSTSWEQIRRESRPADDTPQSTDGSSWAEKRRGAGQSPQDYTYAGPDDGKDQSREQSQKQFDEMLEKERRGEAEPRRKW